MESSTTDIGSWVLTASRLLEAVENPTLEARLILGAVIHQPRVKGLTHPEWVLQPSQLESLEQMLARRISGEPLPYLLGSWEFYGLDIQVNPAVLIPRPETELLVEVALNWLSARPNRRRAADVGTGSGAISAALLTRVPDLRITATDVSADALAVAEANLRRHGVLHRASLIQSDLLADCDGPFDLVCANLPYIPTHKLPGLEVARHEPALALDGGFDGLRLIERLLVDAPRWLAPGGLLLLEIEAEQGVSGIDLAKSCFPGVKIELHADLAGLPRLIAIENL